MDKNVNIITDFDGGKIAIEKAKANITPAIGELVQIATDKAEYLSIIMLLYFCSEILLLL